LFDDYICAAFLYCTASLMAHLHSQQITKAGEETQQNAFAVNVHLWMAMAYSTITVAFLTENITIMMKPFPKKKKKKKTFKPKFKICIFEFHIKFPSFGLDKKNPRIKLVSHTKNETAKISAFKKQNKKKNIYFILFTVNNSL